MKRISLLILMAAGLTPASAAQRSMYVSRGTTRLSSGLVVVPFAVPVAVPVATVQKPSVLYGYRGYAAGHAAGSFPTTTTPRIDEPPSDAAAVLARHCRSCHQNAAAEGQMQLFDESGQLLSRLPRRRVLEAVQAGRMPKPLTAPRLTAAEIELIRRWAEPPRDLVY